MTSRLWIPNGTAEATVRVGITTPPPARVRPHGIPDSLPERQAAHRRAPGNVSLKWAKILRDP